MTAVQATVQASTKCAMLSVPTLSPSEKGGYGNTKEGWLASLSRSRLPRAGGGIGTPTPPNPPRPKGTRGGRVTCTFRLLAAVETDADAQSAGRAEGPHRGAADVVTGVRQVLRGNEDREPARQRPGHHGVRNRKTRERQQVLVVLELRALEARLHRDCQPRRRLVPDLREALVPRHLRHARALERPVGGEAFDPRVHPQVARGEPQGPDLASTLDLEAVCSRAAEVLALAGDLVGGH